jgi:peptide/nickel transport system substrate-binding protein
MALIIAFSLVACNKTPTAPNGTPTGNGGESSGESSGHKSITIGVSSFLGRFLAGLSPSESMIACDAVFDSIFRIDPKTKAAISDVVASWTWTDDTTLEVKLREDVYFSNGDNATAEDVIFSYSNHIERGSNYLDDYPLLMDECVATDKYTAIFKFSAPFPDFVNHPIYLYDKAWSQNVGWESMEWYNNPIGSGPYKVTEYVSDDHMTLKARDDYWNKDAGPIEVDEWVIKYYPDTGTMFMDLELGTIQLCNVEAQDFGRYLKDGGDGYECMQIPAGCVTYFSFGYLCNPIWKDKRIREAISLCADWNEIGKLIDGDLFVPATSMVPVESPQYVNPGEIEYNPEKALALLTEAGYGLENPLKITTYMMEDPSFKNFCESFQSYAKKVGIECDIQYGDVSAALAKWLDPTYVIDFGYLFNNVGSPTFNLYNGMYGANMREGVTFAYVDDEKFQTLMNSLAFTVDKDQVIKNAKELQQYIYDETLLIPIGEMQIPMGYRTDTFTEQQIEDYIVSVDYYEIGRLGMASAWK